MSKKAVIFGLVMFFVIVVGVLLFGFFNSSNNSQPTNIDSSIIPTIHSDNSENRQTFYEMEISVPENWSYEKAAFPGGESFVMRPKSNPSDSYFPSIIIERRPVSGKAELENRIGLFLNSGMKRTTRQINGETVEGAIGVNPLKTEINGTVSPYYDALFLYPHGDSVYFIEYKYEGDMQSPDLERVFDMIISSIKFN